MNINLDAQSPRSALGNLRLFFPSLLAGSIGAAYAARTMVNTGFLLRYMLNGYPMPDPVSYYLFQIGFGAVLALFSLGVIGARPWAPRGLVVTASIAALYEVGGALQFIVGGSGELLSPQLRGYAIVIAMLIASALLAGSKGVKAYVAYAKHHLG